MAAERQRGSGMRVVEGCAELKRVMMIGVGGCTVNVTEELFVLTLLLCGLGHCSVQVSIQHSHPRAGVHPLPCQRSISPPP